MMPEVPVTPRGSHHAPGRSSHSVSRRVFESKAQPMRCSARESAAKGSA